MKRPKVIGYFRAPRTDFRLARLPDDQRKQLEEWLTREHLTYVQAILRLQERFQVKTSLGAISNFYRRFCSPGGKARDFAKQAEQRKTAVT